MRLTMAPGIFNVVADIPRQGYTYIVHLESYICIFIVSTLLLFQLLE